MNGEWNIDHLHVVVWEAGRVSRAYEWYDWLKIPVEERPWDNTMLRAKDELDAMMRAERGEEWHIQNKRMEQSDDA